ncbi:hypothetical protein LYSHEL_00610 [Lysobacter helvus]|uniref:Uncharacterized protein n=2 Tax=Lysobacteraceae TaxID=32033 RepID=A0ABN6FSU7_9GAMM|nr:MULTISPECIES: hypothetical protein [Lysobacter]BCT91037.1 hypothetical protein LYSCAS_00610 [Lysobacter caseinilyticus]BCT94190.1 hypothetical protein LYSHEL_00610 [Lysobacter helvus]
MASRVANIEIVQTKRVLNGLQPLLHGWLKVVHDFCAADQFEDNPWWYNERASLSTLAGAAWRLPRWNALEEFSTTKRGVLPDGDVDRRENVRGRCDLYVAHATTSFAIEAKQAWQPIGSRARKNYLAPAMQAAKRDAGNLTSDQADHRLAVVFVAPHIPLAAVSQEGKRGKRIVDAGMAKEAFAGWLGRLDTGALDAHAVHFSGRCHDFVSEHDRVFPGVLMAVKRCKRGARGRRNS